MNEGIKIQCEVHKHPFMSRKRGNGTILRCEDCYDNEIERLQKLNTSLENLIEDKENQIMDLHPRIEELEQDRDFWAKMAKKYKDDYNECIRTGKCADGHHITNEQIDAAWAHWTTYGSADVKGALAELSIKRCGGCELLQVEIDNDPNAEGSYEAVCPDCNGHGWKIGGEDE